MFKTISVFVLAALFVVSCSSEKEQEEKKRNYKETVYAFINSNPRIAGFGHIDVGAIMKDGKVESNEAFRTFAEKEYGELKQQLDLSAPIYFASEAPKSGEAVVYILAKLKNKEKFVADWTESGFIFKEHKDITYTEDGDFLWGLHHETVIVVVTPGKYEAKTVISEAFKFTEGEIAKGELKKEIDTPGDMAMHIDVERMAENQGDQDDIDIKGLEADITMNFDKGKMVIEATSNKTKELKEQLDFNKSDTPLLAKKVVNADGKVVMAMQLSVDKPSSKLLPMEDVDVNKEVDGAGLLLTMIDETLTFSDVAEGDNIKMPESGKAMGSEPFEMYLDIDGLAPLFPKYEEYMKTLDYASFEVRDESLRFVIGTHDSNENFLATVLKVAEEVVMTGKWMQLAM